MSNNLYAERDIECLDEDGNFYFKHVMAMTAEGLHSKSDIAAELGYRDSKIVELQSRLERAKEERDALSQKLRAAQHEAEALAATVEALQSRVSAAERVEMMFSEVPEIIFEECEKLFPEEIRDIQAEAGRAGFIAGAFWESNQVADGIEQDCESEASKYAERVKEGE